MIPLLIIFAFAALSAASLYFFVRGQATDVREPQQLLELTRPVDLNAFRNLLDPQAETFLSHALAPREFHRLQRQRAKVTLAYVEALAHNAALLLKLGEAARSNPDPVQREAGNRLVNSALEMRLLSLTAMLKLRIAITIPARNFGMTAIADSYSQLSESAYLLCRMQSPAAASRIMAAL